MLRSHFCPDEYCTRVYFKEMAWNFFLNKIWEKTNKLRFDECEFLRYSKGSSYLAEHQFGKRKVKIGAGYLFKSKDSKDRLLLPYSKTKCIYVIKINWGFTLLHKLVTGYIFNSTLFALNQKFFFSKLVFLVQSVKRLI